MWIQASNKSTVSSGLGKKRMEHSNRDIDNTLMNKLFAKPWLRLKKANKRLHILRLSTMVNEPLSTWS